MQSAWLCRDPDKTDLVYVSGCFSSGGGCGTGCFCLTVCVQLSEALYETVFIKVYASEIIWGLGLSLFLV